MRTMGWISMLCAAGAACVLMACGDKPETTSGTTGTGGMGTGGMGTGGMGTGGMGTGGMGTGGAGGNPNLINGCDPATAEDDTGKATFEIKFGLSGLKYEPPCITVSVNTAVTFTGAFQDHPLRAGEVKGGKATNDPNSPIKSYDGTVPTPESKTYTLANAGTYPYYCNIHGPGGMMGTVFVK